MWVRYVYMGLITILFVLRRSQAARGKDGLKDGVSEMGTRLDPVPGLPGGQSSSCSIKTCYWSKTIFQFDVNPFFFLLCFSSPSATSFRRRGSSKLLQPGPQQLPRCHEHFSASTSGYQPTTSRWSVFEIIDKAFITCVLQCGGRQCIEMFSFCLITYSC